MSVKVPESPCALASLVHLQLEDVQSVPHNETVARPVPSPLIGETGGNSGGMVFAGGDGTDFSVVIDLIGVPEHVVVGAPASICHLSGVRVPHEEYAPPVRQGDGIHPISGCHSSVILEREARKRFMERRHSMKAGKCTSMRNTRRLTRILSSRMKDIKEGL